VIGTALAKAVGARDVSFLIADFSGQSLIRLSHVAFRASGGTLAQERTETVPMAGTPDGRALAEHTVQAVAEDGATRLFAPVSSRGVAVGVLEPLGRRRAR
jgi:hypothetical protein